MTILADQSSPLETKKSASTTPRREMFIETYPNNLKPLGGNLEEKGFSTDSNFPLSHF